MCAPLPSLPVAVVAATSDASINTAVKATGPKL